MFDSETALEDGASDLGFDLVTGGLPDKREFARVVTTWKMAKDMAETKLQTDAVARAHGVPVTLLPCDWSSFLTEFEKKFGSHIADDRIPARSLFEHFQQDLKKPEPARQCNQQLELQTDDHYQKASRQFRDEITD